MDTEQNSNSTAGQQEQVTAAQTQPEQAAEAAQDENPYAAQFEYQDGREAQEGGDEDEGQEEEDGEYVLDIAEDSGVQEPVAKILREEARAAGINSRQASRFLNAVFAKQNALGKQIYEAQDRKLRAEWGIDFKRRLEQTRRYAGHLANLSGLTEEEMDVLKTPAGYRLMYKLMNATGELNAGAAGGNRGKYSAAMRGPLTDSERKAMRKDMLTNPNNPYYRGLVDTTAPANERRAAEKAFNDTFDNMKKPF